MHSRVLGIKGRRSLTVRPLADGDADTVAAVLDRSSTAAPGVEVSDLARVDESRHTLVAYVARDPCPAAIGQLARMSRNQAEMVLAVADRYAGAGVDDALVELLSEDARAAGLGGPPTTASKAEVRRSRGWRRLVQAATQA
ncbi:MAG TPA: hypothetical protein VFJ78_06880 [Gaiellaceae bacterium]|nr:hypothetical protein [Gaiellaceae bacterium]